MQDLEFKQFSEGGTFHWTLECWLLRVKKKNDKTRRRKITGPKISLEETSVRTALSLRKPATLK